MQDVNSGVLPGISRPLIIPNSCNTLGRTVMGFLSPSQYIYKNKFQKYKVATPVSHLPISFSELIPFSLWTIEPV